MYDNVPESLLQEGRDLLVGKVCSVIRKDDLYELTVDLYENIRLVKTLREKSKSLLKMFFQK